MKNIALCFNKTILIYAESMHKHENDYFSGICLEMFADSLLLMGMFYRLVILPVTKINTSNIFKPDAYGQHVEPSRCQKDQKCGIAMRRYTNVQCTSA